MKTFYAVAVSMVAGFGLGVVAIQTLHAQAKPKAYLVSESEILDPAALAVSCRVIDTALLGRRSQEGRSHRAVIAAIGDPSHPQLAI